MDKPQQKRKDAVNGTPEVTISVTADGLYLVEVKGESGCSCHTNLKQVAAQLAVIFGRDEP